MKKNVSIFFILLAMTMTGYSQANNNLSNLLSPTAVNVSLLPVSKNTQNLGSSTFPWKNLYMANYVYIDGYKYIHNTGTSNVFIGKTAGNSISSGSQNVALGDKALYAITTGTANAASGFEALIANNSGQYNTAIGAITLHTNTSGSFNMAAGSYALYFNTTGINNSASGYKAMYSNTIGYDNTANGVKALWGNTEGYRNTAAGFQSLYSNSTGTYNTAIGSFALWNSLNGNNNTAAGSYALYSTTSGFNNTAIGLDALYLNSTGSYNTASGVDALYFNASGNYNTAFGNDALHFNTDGIYNTASGNEALYSNTNGSGNTAIGNSAIHSNITGDNNTAVGNFIDVNNGNYSNSSAFGAGVTITASNQVRVGNSAVNSIGGYAGWTTLPSDGRAKKNLKANVPGLAFINKLKPLTYNLDLEAIDKIIQAPVARNGGSKVMERSQQELEAIKEKEEVTYSGFIAQDVQQAAKELNYDFSGVDVQKNDRDMYGIRYADFVVPLVKAVQELDKKSQRIDELETEVKDLKELVQSLLQPKQLPGKIAYLNQNMPNPSNDNTVIGYYVPANAGHAQIRVTDSKGSVIKIFNVTEGQGQINIRSGILPAGTYNYTLFVGERSMDTKQMVITR